MCTVLPLTLIVVDDDEHIRRAVGRVLRSHGHKVLVFDSAEACLANGCRADCAIVDDRLMELGRRIPAVFITAHDELTIFQAVHQRQRPLLKKPLDEESLLAAIAAVTNGQNR
jgi:FixJ family two-component response regulator